MRHAAAFDRDEPVGQIVVARLPQELGPGRIDGARDCGLHLGRRQGEQAGTRLDLAPQRRQRPMQQQAAAHGVDAGPGFGQRFGTEAMPGEGAERACRLIAEHVGAARAVMRSRECGRPTVRATFDARAGEDAVPIDIAGIARRGGGRVVGRGKRDAREHRARPQFAIAVARGVAEHHVRRTGAQQGSGAFSEAAFPVGTGVRNTTLALQCHRQKRIGARGRWPGFVVQTGHEQMVEGLTGGFEQAENLHRHGVGFGLEQRIGAQAREPRQRLADTEIAQHVVQHRQARHDLAPFLPGLELVAVQRSFARPAQRRQQRHEGAAPRRRPLAQRACCGGERLPGAEAREQGRARATLAPVGAFRFTLEGRKRHRQLPTLAQGRVEQRAGRRFGLAFTQERAAQQGPHPGERQLAPHQTQRRECRRDQWIAGQRQTERHIERPCRRGVGTDDPGGFERVVEYANHFGAPFGKIGNHDADAQCRVRVEQRTGLVRDRREFVAREKVFTPLDDRGHAIGLALVDVGAEAAQHADQAALLWREGVEAEQDQAPRRPLRLLGQQRCHPIGQVRGAHPAARIAFAFDRARPGEPRFAIARASRRPLRRVQSPRNVQLVRGNRHPGGGHRVEQGIGVRRIGDGLLPHRLFFGGGEQARPRLVAREVGVQASHPGGPGQDVGRGPGAKARGLTIGIETPANERGEAPVGGYQRGLGSQQGGEVRRHGVKCAPRSIGTRAPRADQRSSRCAFGLTSLYSSASGGPGLLSMMGFHSRASSALSSMKARWSAGTSSSA